MFKFKKIYILALMSIIMITGVFSVSGYAATGSQGYAVYRDGVYKIEWHAALMDEPSSTYSLPVMHITGSGSTVDWGTWAEFMDNETFKGVYRPNGGINSTGRDNVVAMGRNLRIENIGYTALAQIGYNPITNPSSWVRPQDITSIRCDGVVEYCYEWFGYRIYGSDTLWDITVSSLSNLNHHYAAMVTPKSQAENYMTKVQGTVP